MLATDVAARGLGMYSLPSTLSNLLRPRLYIRTCMHVPNLFFIEPETSTQNALERREHTCARTRPRGNKLVLRSSSNSRSSSRTVRGEGAGGEAHRGCWGCGSAGEEYRRSIQRRFRSINVVDLRCCFRPSSGILLRPAETQVFCARGPIFVHARKFRYHMPASISFCAGCGVPGETPGDA
jgi:hypothetical protein